MPIMAATVMVFYERGQGCRTASCASILAANPTPSQFALDDRVMARYHALHGTCWCTEHAFPTPSGHHRILRSGSAAGRRTLWVRPRSRAIESGWTDRERRHHLPAPGPPAPGTPRRDRVARV